MATGSTAKAPPLIPDVLPIGLTVLYGDNEGALRHTAVDWARTAAWSGQTVLYAAGTEADVVQSLRRSWDAAYLTGPDVRFQMLRPSELDSSFPDLGDIDSAAWLSKALEVVAPDLLVVDPLAAACGGSDVRSEDVAARVAATAQGLHSRLGVSTLLVHHDDEIPATLREAADCIWFAFASQVRGYLSLVNRKASPPVPCRRLNFRLKQVGAGAVVTPSVIEDIGPPGGRPGGVER